MSFSVIKDSPLNLETHCIKSITVSIIIIICTKTMFKPLLYTTINMGILGTCVNFASLTLSDEIPTLEFPIDLFSQSLICKDKNN